jgi:hypothetical protein
MSKPYVPPVKPYIPPQQTIHDRENTIHAKFRDGRIPDATITASTKTVKRMVSKNGKGII